MRIDSQGKFSGSPIAKRTRQIEVKPDNSIEIESVKSDFGDISMNDLLKGGLRFEVRNLGIIRTGSFTQKPLTVFCGPNNSGKTWAMYSLYHFYRSLPRAARTERRSEERNPGTVISLEKFNNYVSSGLAELFNTSSKELGNATFQFKTSNNWRQIIEKADTSTHVFLMPAERSGIHLFYRELSVRRTALLHHASKKKINIPELLRDVIRSPYALPIAD